MEVVLVALFWIVAGSLALMLVAPPLLFVYLSLEAHLARRPSQAALSSNVEKPTLLPARDERAALRPAA